MRAFYRKSFGTESEKTPWSSTQTLSLTESEKTPWSSTAAAVADAIIIIITISILGSFTSCTNPRLEDELGSLREQILAIDIDKFNSDIIDLRSSISDISLSVDDIISDIIEYTNEYNETNAELLLSLEDMSDSLSSISVVLSSAATSDQVSVLRAQIEELSASLAILISYQDYDFDGVLNGVDECPDTPLEDRSSVDDTGCVP